MPQARGDLLLQLTENLETLIRRASEQTAFARTVEHGQVYITNESVMDGNSSTPLYIESSESRNPQCSRLQGVLTSHVKIGSVTGFEYFNYAGTLVIEVQVPSQQPRNSKSWVRKLRGIEQYARQNIPTETDHQYLEAASSQQLVNKLWVTVSIGNKWKFDNPI